MRRNRFNGLGRNGLFADEKTVETVSEYGKSRFTRLMVINELCVQTRRFSVTPLTGLTTNALSVRSEPRKGRPEGPPQDARAPPCSHNSLMTISRVLGSVR